MTVVAEVVMCVCAHPREIQLELSLTDVLWIHTRNCPRSVVPTQG